MCRCAVFQMNPIPLSPIVRLLATIGKESGGVADITSRFSVCVKPVGTPLRRIASQIRSMSAVSRQFGDVVQEIDGSSAEKQSEFSFDADRLMRTTKACQAVLKDIKASVSQATGRVATDLDYLKRAVEMSPRERVAYGLTETDLRLIALRVEQGTIELRLQKEQLVQQIVFLDSSST